MKKVTESRRLHLDARVVRRLDDADLTKVQGAANYSIICPTHVQALCSGMCWLP